MSFSALSSCCFGVVVAWGVAFSWRLQTSPRRNILFVFFVVALRVPAPLDYSYDTHFTSGFGARTGCTVPSGSPLCSRRGLVVWISLLTSPNSGAKIHGGDLRSVATISVFFFSFGASFSSFQLILSTLSSDTRDSRRAGRGGRDKAKPGILLCAPLGFKGPRGKVQSATGQWYDVHANMFRRDNIPEGPGQGDQCWRCTKEVGQVPWPVLRTTAWAFPNATMRTTDARGQWWGPVLRLPKEVQEDEEAQGEVEVWWGEEKEGQRTGVQLGWDTVRGLQEEDDGVAVSFRMTNAGGPDREAPIVPVGHKCGESARRIRLTVHGLPADRVGYLVLVQAYLEQGSAKGDRAWCHGVV